MKELRPPTTLSFSANSLVSHYRIVRKLGAGGMGEVYLAEDTKLDRQVALKILPQEFAADPERMNRFIREAKSASALNHPNIITIYEINEIDSTHFITAEYIEGETLHTRLRRQPLDVRNALEIAIQIASALDAAHSAGIVHRDIKPDNVMIRPDGLIKVLDFGIAKLAEPKAKLVDEDAETAIKSPSTNPGMVIGTANYMSPEQAKGTEVDARTDTFSFGIVLYEMLTGKRAFSGDTPVETISAILKDEPQPIGQLVPGLPREFERIVGKTLRKNRDERYQTARDLLTDLKDVKQELEFQHKLDRTSAPNREEAGTELINASTTDAPVTTSSAEYIAGEIKKHKVAVGLAALVMLALVVGVGFWFFFNRSTNSKQIESIAVLPFVNESGNQDVEYLSDGMTETLINSLSQLPNLSVKARSSVFRYKGKEIDPKKIAAELGVQAILTGRVAQRGDQIKLNLELVDALTENVLWGNQYERKSAELVTLQSEVARDVSSKLKTRLSGAEAAQVAKNYTTDAEAYQLYLKGKFYWNKRTKAALEQAVVFYKQAIDKDSTYALAYSGLAETYGLFSSYDVAPATDSMPQAKAAALRALELDEKLAEAHTALGFYLSNYEWDRAGAEKEYRRAIELKPNYATAHHWFGTDLANVKRFDDSLAELTRAGELDPLSPIIGTNLGDLLVHARRYDEAIAQFKHVLVRDPNFSYAHQALGWAYGCKGMYPEAIAETRASLELSHSPVGKGYLALWLAKSGKRDEALKLLNELKQESAQSYVQSYTFALIHLGFGEKEEALKYLEKHMMSHAETASNYATLPELDGLRSEPRFKEMLKRMNLPE